MHSSLSFIKFIDSIEVPIEESNLIAIEMIEVMREMRLLWMN